ncbi:DUF5753 domain-containing protein [Actinokineospora enzanensis]|uniref:DUF5753 domain-containing protein n=1 Tax=Actinokineospora enzanensis TaxID=155975 RepID=UPI00037DCBB8|nr:DUF5753 domain-containing protein [Actinokineospora enzanensis]
MLADPNDVTTDPPDDRFVALVLPDDEWITEFLDQEQAATRIVVGSTMFFPRLVQTGAYARAVLKDKDDVEACVATRLRRQDVLTRTRFLAFLHYPTFRTPLVAPADMAEQARKLLELGARDNVTIRIVPEQAGYTPLANGPFGYLEFRAATPVVQLEHLRHGISFWHARVVESVQRSIDQLDECALDPAASAAFIAAEADRWTGLG